MSTMLDRSGRPWAVAERAEQGPRGNCPDLAGRPIPQLSGVVPGFAPRRPSG